MDFMEGTKAFYWTAALIKREKEGTFSDGKHTDM
jgi:hypothetical protein